LLVWALVQPRRGQVFLACQEGIKLGALLAFRNRDPPLVTAPFPKRNTDPLAPAARDGLQPDTIRIRLRIKVLPPRSKTATPIAIPLQTVRRPGEHSSTKQSSKNRDKSRRITKNGAAGF